MKVDVLNFIPWTEMIQKYSLAHDIDLTTAAFEIKKELESYGELQVIKNVIKNAEEDLEAIAALRTLRSMGYMKKDIYDLVKVISAWSGSLSHLDYKALATELLPDVVLKNNGNLRKDGIKDPDSCDSGNNGYGGPSMNDWIRLNLLRSNTARQLGRLNH